MGNKARIFTYVLGGLGLAAVAASIAVTASPGFAEGFSGGRHHGHGHHRPAFGMLMQMDSDGDGKVTRAEIEAFNAARAAAVDSNQDGEVTVAELEAYREAQRQQRLAAHLAAMDSDGDGKVSVAEFEAASTWRLARLDRDGDGIIEMREPGRHGSWMQRGPGMGIAPDADAGGQGGAAE